MQGIKLMDYGASFVPETLPEGLDTKETHHLLSSSS